MIIELSQLEDTAAYCVIRDESNRESILVSGRGLKSRALSSPDFKRYREREIIALPNYVRVRVDSGTFLGVWLDPLRPELQEGETNHVAPFRVEAVNAAQAERARPVLSLAMAASYTNPIDLCLARIS